MRNYLSASLYSHTISEESPLYGTYSDIKQRLNDISGGDDKITAKVKDKIKLLNKIGLYVTYADLYHGGDIGCTIEELIGLSETCRKDFSSKNFKIIHDLLISGETYNEIKRKISLMIDMKLDHRISKGLPFSRIVKIVKNCKDFDTRALKIIDISDTRILTGEDIWFIFRGKQATLDNIEKTLFFQTKSSLKVAPFREVQRLSTISGDDLEKRHELSRSLYFRQRIYSLHDIRYLYGYGKEVLDIDNAPSVKRIFSHMNPQKHISLQFVESFVISSGDEFEQRLEKFTKLSITSREDMVMVFGKDSISLTDLQRVVSFKEKYKTDCYGENMSLSEILKILDTFLDQSQRMLELLNRYGNTIHFTKDHRRLISEGAFLNYEKLERALELMTGTCDTQEIESNLDKVFTMIMWYSSEKGNVADSWITEKSFLKERFWSWGEGPDDIIF